MKQDNIVAVIGVLIVLTIIGLTLVCPYFEMRSFNKFSKTKATYWDALWTELRVIPN